MSKKVAIVYGWAEGHYHGLKLRKQLRRAGFIVTKRAATADIIIAHSAGGLILPKHIKAEKILLIGLPYWPGKNLFKSFREKLRLEFRDQASLSQWLKKTFYNAIYMLKPRQNYKKKRNFTKQLYPDSLSSSFIVVRNRHDTYLHPKKVIDLASEKSWTLLSLPGQHDDLWISPEPYIDLLK